MVTRRMTRRSIVAIAAVAGARARERWRARGGDRRTGSQPRPPIGGIGRSPTPTPTGTADGDGHAGPDGARRSRPRRRRAIADGPLLVPRATHRASRDAGGRRPATRSRS